MTARTYATPLQFKQALEGRLRNQSTTGADLARHRQLLIFDRFLARLQRTLGDALILKGGLALELRLARARTTKDIDLRLIGPTDQTLARLQEAARLDLADFLTFEVVPDDDHPEIQTDGVRYEGQRFRTECRLAGKPYGNGFGVDVAFGDPVSGNVETLECDRILDFIGVDPPSIQIYPIETHIAEKLHAYTMPRPRPNSRVKDLPDMALLGTIRALESRRLRDAIVRTFEFRGTHPVPPSLPQPPAGWALPYGAMALSNQLVWRTLVDVTQAAADLMNPVLGGAPGIWDPTSWQWSP